MSFLPSVFGSPDDDDRLPRFASAELAHASGQGALAFHRLSNVAMLSRIGMMEVCNLTHLQVDLEAGCPAASGRLNLIGDMAAGAVATEIAKLVAP